MDTKEYNISTLLAVYGAKRRERDELTAPFDKQIKTLEHQRAEACAALTFELDTLEALIKPLVLAARCTQKIAGVTATYITKDGWDSAILKEIAKEVPSVLQAHKDISFVTIRLSR